MRKALANRNPLTESTHPEVGLVGRAPGERANATSDDGILSVKPQKMYEFPHTVFFAVVVEVAF
jgi:hypothetical protein